MQYIQCWSGGKDSTASIILEHIHELPPSLIIMSEVMFDNKHIISGELPEHMEWIHDVAIPQFHQWGYDVKVLHSDKDYLNIFYRTFFRSNIPERNGKYYGFPIPGKCAINSRCKIEPIKKFIKNIKGEFIQYVGIASDEPKRLERLHGTNKKTLLEKYGYTGQMAYSLCKKYNLLSPIYQYSKRGGCWFCPNSRISQFAHIKQCYPELWKELYKLAHSENLMSQRFTYNKSFDDIDREVNAYIEGQKSQLSLFDIC